MALKLLQSFVSSVPILWCLSMLLLLHQASHKTAMASTRLGRNEKDRIALLSIKAQITHDPMLITSSWNDSLHFCQWKGVLCGQSHPRVTGLNLESYNLAGFISPSIGNLSFLRIVNFTNNSFHGGIPHEMGRLFRLRVLDLGINLLEGQIPGNLSHCNNLRILSLDQNKFIGNLPKELGSLSQLVELNIQLNYLTRPIPASFGNLSTLQSFMAGGNMLEGNIPGSLGSLKGLRFLGLARNKLSGIIPPSIYNLSSLVLFWAPFNQLNGSLPQTLGLTLPNIQTLSFVENQLSGLIPGSISNASNLELLDLQRNKFSPGVPINFGNLKNLSWLYLSESGLGTGDISDLNFISTLVNCSKLIRLYIANNSFGGVLPNSIANFSTQLQHLAVAENKISGSIPPDIGNLVSLNILGLYGNQLTGSIPTSIGRLHKLQLVAFGGNKLSGEIPSSIGNLTLLNKLGLQENNLQGNIPSTLGNCQGLLLLHLYGNNLSGSIPREVIGLSSLSISLDLSRNSLSGPLPQEVGKLRNLGLLKLSHNKLTSEIPSSLSSCISLQYLYLDNNSFKGVIPQSLESLRAIEELDLSYNSLAGEIPKFLGSFTFLTKLDLSFNDLEGEIPAGKVFQNASAISVLGNNKLCGGITALELPSCPDDQPRKKKMPLGLALLIPIVCGVLSIILTSFILILCWLRKMRKQPSVASSLMDSWESISYNKLFKATNGFSSANLIGTGSFGSVYKGILNPSDQKAIAVKVFNQQRRGATKSFMAECKALKNIRHRNLVKIITACASVDFQANHFKALVYEYMENGSLEYWLHPVLSQTGHAQEQQKSLSLLQRLGIAIDVASALDYLHNHCHVLIVHRDIKPSNILLDGDMTAHVGDFGLARLLQQCDISELSESQISSVGTKGTIGYVAPEYGMGNEVSTTGDVYSYGILLLELFTEKRPTDGMFIDGIDLHKLAKLALPERVMEIVDQNLLEEEEGASINSSNQMKSEKISKCLNLIFRIGVACSEQLPRERMTIADAVRELHLAKDILLERRT
ncbi:probable LRR receptor-like serine/threonine-protein kinase At3g47570 [Actinidia eriantha]|uniref:probable LRR receptor-like serine/threonine-protein kinase At3g47570 n=1 Tax=Actinidia eriantha TaxID=165200 RepID=UPI0025835EEF|nr:probable LRR receptor-like serine/threonine-protein kinase At3g47570 [Actinidia eriantha]XP_057498319.1 probable LRR receptor-like serine/threonine-protein kinase At3g47570 [Actinidia eriantha]